MSIVLFVCQLAEDVVQIEAITPTVWIWQLYRICIGLDETSDYLPLCRRLVIVQYSKSHILFNSALWDNPHFYYPLVLIAVQNEIAAGLAREDGALLCGSPFDGRNRSRNFLYNGGGFLIGKRKGTPACRIRRGE